MDLVRDLLDLQVRDCRYRSCGRVDGIVLELRDGQPPVVSAIDIGGAVLAGRVHPRVRVWFERLASRLGMSTQPVRVAMSDVQTIDLQLTLDFDAVDDGRLMEGERAAARYVQRRAPTR